MISICLQPAISTFRLFSQITCMFSLQPPRPCSVSRFSPFTAGLGYSFRRQAHSVSLLLRVTERQRERERREEGVGGGTKNEKKKAENKLVPQLCRRIEKREVNKETKESERKILEEHQSQREVQRSWHMYDSLFHSLRPSPSLNIFSFALFSPPFPSLPAVLFYYL